MDCCNPCNSQTCNGLDQIKIQIKQQIHLFHCCNNALRSVTQSISIIWWRVFQTADNDYFNRILDHFIRVFSHLSHRNVKTKLNVKQASAYQGPPLATPLSVLKPVWLCDNVGRSWNICFICIIAYPGSMEYTSSIISNIVHYVVHV